MAVSERYGRLQRLMEKEGLDVTVVISPENTLYFAETYIMTQSSIRDRLAIAVLPLEKEPVFIGCSIEQSTIESETWIEDKRFYTEFMESPIAFLASVLREKGLDHGKVGVELDYLMAHYYREMVELLPDVEFVPCTRLFDKIRMIKEPVEIEMLSKAAQSTRAALERALLETHPGDTEFQLASKIKRYMLEDGADYITFLVMGTGDHSGQTHKLPDQDVLAEGELMRIDYGASYSFGNYHCYNSDVARTVLIGKPNPLYVDVMKRLCEAYYYTYDHVRAGVTAKELYTLCKEKCEALGLNFACPHIGHSLGIGLHEFPMLSPKEDFELEENMVFCIEPVIRQHNRMFHQEDLVLVKKGGYQVLSQDVFQPRYLEIH
ncbi:MAG: aminopeptidase P family protein [Oscillibacter sp.]|nr:aminopeptidase P family protein [Oscillibacter sp.]